MNKYFQIRAAQILGCKVVELPSNFKDIRTALNEKKAQAIAERELAKGVKHDT